MTDETNQSKAPFLEYSPGWILRFCGGVMALSVASVQIGFDDVIRAYAKSITLKLERTQECSPEPETESILKRITNLEVLSHSALARTSPLVKKD